ncbi:MOXD2 protein, partial [Pomatostomus ruficeps]|nr:MOXD2 protein [Pomatostomus ruficeps]
MVMFFSGIKRMPFLLFLPYFCSDQLAPSLLCFSTFLDSFSMFYLHGNHDKQELMRCELHIHAAGWVASGFSPHGELPGSDIVTGGVFPNDSICFSVI